MFKKCLSALLVSISVSGCRAGESELASQPDPKGDNVSVSNQETALISKKVNVVTGILRYTVFPGAAKNEIILGILGSGSVNSQLLTLNSVGTSGIKIKPKLLSNVYDALSVDAVFFAESFKTQVPTALKQMEKKYIVTISDIDGFAKLGGEFELFLDTDGVVRMKADKTVIDKSLLSFSSQLLKLVKFL